MKMGDKMKLMEERGKRKEERGKRKEERINIIKKLSEIYQTAIMY